MAVEAVDLIQPNGPVSNLLFPGVPSNVLEENLTIYLGRATVDPRIVSEPNADKTDSLVRALALHLVFQDAFIEMNARPLSVQQTEKGGHGFSTEQIRNMRALADKYLLEFMGLLTPKAGSAKKGGTQAVKTKVTW
jgi:hypothetical protein